MNYGRRRGKQTRKTGNFDASMIDVEAAMARGDLNHIFFRINGASNDNVNTVFFRLCGRYRIGCAGTWHMGGHAPMETGVNLPAYGFGGGIPDQPEQVTFDLTLRRLKLDGAVQWRMGEQTGAGIVRDGVLTINNLSLLSGVSGCWKI